MEATNKRPVGRPRLSEGLKGVSITLRFTYIQAEKLRAICSESGISLSTLVRTVLDSFEYGDLQEALAKSNQDALQLLVELKKAAQECDDARQRCLEASTRAGHARKLALAYLKRTYDKDL